MTIRPSATRSLCLIQRLLKKLSRLLEDVEQLVHAGGAEHGDAGRTEVGDALEDGRGGQMAAGVNDAALHCQVFRLACP